MESNGRDELKEELEKLDKMNPYERLSYIGKLARFYRQMELFGAEDVKVLINDILRATKGYDK